jgi:hypothetical protein
VPCVDVIDLELDREVAAPGAVHRTRHHRLHARTGEDREHGARPADEGEGAVALHGGLEESGVEGAQSRNIVADESNAVETRSHPATVAEQPGEA